IIRLLETARARVLVAAGPELDPEVWSTARAVAAELHVTALYALRPTGSEGPGPELEPLAGTVVGHLHTAAAGHPQETAPQPP
ncbi:acyl-CoA synthetase, partial [Streptomyces sp. SID8455]|nr:acyl-CoA synthetase [Streptomyces sp. SID8455]